MNKISKGTKVFYSVCGYNNFYYPGDNFTILTEDIVINKLHWIGGGDLKACKIVSAKEKNVVWAQEKNILHLEDGTN